MLEIKPCNEGYKFAVYKIGFEHHPLVQLTYLDTRQHDSDQVIIRQQESSHNATITDVLNNG